MMFLSRQDLPHRGYGYETSNYRSFVYVDVVGIDRAPEATHKIWLTKSRLRPKYCNNGQWRIIDSKNAKPSFDWENIFST